MALACSHPAEFLFTYRLGLRLLEISTLQSKCPTYSIIPSVPQVIVILTIGPVVCRARSDAGFPRAHHKKQFSKIGIPDF